MSSLLCKNSVVRIYQEVIEDVISGVRELFLEDGVDEQVLQELKQTWETKFMSSKAVQEDPSEKVKKGEHTASNGFPKVVNNPVSQVAAQTAPQQQHPQQILQQQIQLDKLVPIQITLPPQPGSDGAQRVLTIQVPASALQGNQLQKVLTGPVITATMGLPPNIASSLLQQHVNAAFNSQQQAAVTTIVNKSVIQTDGAADQAEFDIEMPCSSSHNDYQAGGSADTRTGEAGGSSESEGGICIEIILPKNRRKRDALRKLKQKSLIQADGPNDTSDDDEDGSDDDNDDDDLDDDKDEDDQEMEDEGGEEEPLNSEDDVTDDDPTDLFDTDNIVVCQYDKIIRNRNRWKFYLKDGIMNLNGADYVFQKATGDAEW